MEWRRVDEMNRQKSHVVNIVELCCRCFVGHHRSMFRDPEDRRSREQVRQERKMKTRRGRMREVRRNITLLIEWITLSFFFLSVNSFSLLLLLTFHNIFLRMEKKSVLEQDPLALCTSRGIRGCIYVVCVIQWVHYRPWDDDTIGKWKNRMRETWEERKGKKEERKEKKEERNEKKEERKEKVAK